jgi:two-component system cell cycle sensor histidine kinase/response regulator CckA
VTTHDLGELGPVLDAVLSVAPVAIIVTEATREVILGNGTGLDAGDLERVCRAARRLGQSDPDDVVRDDGPVPTSGGASGDRVFVDGELLRLDMEDGSSRWLLTRSAPLVTGDGAPAGVVQVVVDHTRQRSARRDMARSERHLRESQQIAGVGSWERAVGSEEALVSEETCRILGIPLTVSLSRAAFFELVHPDDRDWLRTEADRSVSESTARVSRHRIITPGGEERILVTRAAVVPDADGVGSLIMGTIKDVTDEELEEERLRRAQRMETVGQLAGGLAHDLNNLLTVLTGHAHLLEDIVDDASALDSVTAIQTATSRAASLTRQILEFGRREVLQPRPVDVNATLRSHQSTFRRLLPDRVEIDLCLDDHLGNVLVDPVKLDQVLMNLVLNARDALEGSGALIIETTRGELDEAYCRLQGDVAPGWYTLIAFTDTGTGMTPEVLDRAFEPFFTTKSTSEGSGLGLATSYGIIKQSGGHLALYSEPQRGTVARIYLPETSQAIASEPEPAASAALLGTETVLLAEDEPLVRELVSSTLERAGYRVRVAADGRQALELARSASEPMDLLVTDVSMPKMDGHALAQRLTETWPDLKVLFISGYTEHSVVLQGIVDADIAFLGKPFTSRDLLLAARRTLDS